MRIEAPRHGVATIVDKPAGTIALFAFAEGRGLSEHTAPYDALVHILEGQAEVTIAGTAHRLAAGEPIVMPANQLPALRALTGFKMLLTMNRA